MFGELLLTVGVVLIAYGIYKLSTGNAKYYEERNVKYKGASFTLHNLYSMFFGKFDAFGLSTAWYDAFPDEPIYGLFDFTMRQYVVRDPELCKQMFIKDFDHFEDRRALIDEETDEIVASVLANLQGEKWRQMRPTLSPAFTGSKMRQMFELISECAEDVVSYLKLDQAKKGAQLNIELKEFFSKYTLDAIATSAFGIKVNTLRDPNNEFYANGQKIVDFTGFRRVFNFLVIFVAPKVAKFFNIKFFDAAIMTVFKDIILETMETRKKNNIFRPDMINILMQVREGKLTYQAEEKNNGTTEGFATVEESDVGRVSVTQKWNDNQLVAQCFQFFIAGFEASSQALTFAGYELVANPDVQQKLYAEIAAANKQLDGERMTYDVLQKMKYLDQVVTETLRKWAIAAQIDRICVKDYSYDDGDKVKFTIEKGSNIIFPTYGLHHDPKYYPEPQKFNPDRFSDENKHKIISGTYAPFGLGPRNCIGSRFALMQIKAILYYLLLNFSLEPNKDTQIPVKLKKIIFVATEKGVHLELKPRSN